MTIRTRSQSIFSVSIRPGVVSPGEFVNPRESVVDVDVSIRPGVVSPGEYGRIGQLEIVINGFNPPRGGEPRGMAGSPL